MEWIAFASYLIFFCWLIAKVRFIRRSGLSKQVLIFLFLIKVMAGIAYFGFYSLPANKPLSDTWKFYNRSIPETDILLKDPVGFAKGIFISKYSRTGGLFSDHRSYWRDIKDEFMVKLMAVVNVFTFKNYYANIVWFNFIFFIGLIAFYRLLKEIYAVKNWALVLAVFLIPSFLFWSSGIHKDGLIFSSLGLILFSFHRMLTSKRIYLYLSVIIFCLCILFLLRNYLVFVLVPCMLVGYLLHLFPARKYIILLSFLLAGGLLVFGGKYLHPSFDIPAYIVTKHSEFKRLTGGSIIETQKLEPTFGSFIASLPSAVDIGFFRPHLTEKGLISKVASAEIICLWLLFFFCMIRRKRTLAPEPIKWVCWLFAIITLFIIGYTVPFSGAVVRYRSILLPLILAPALGSLYINTYIIKKYI